MDSNTAETLTPNPEIDSALEEALAEPETTEPEAEEPEKIEADDETGEQETEKTEGEAEESETTEAAETTETADETADEGEDDLPVSTEEVAEVIKSTAPPAALPDNVLLNIQTEADKIVLNAMGVEEIPDPDLDRVAYDRFRKLSDNYARRMEGYVAVQTSAKMEADRFFMDLGKEKREEFAKFFDGTIEKMAKKGADSEVVARNLISAIQSQDYAVVFPVVKKVYQAFVTKHKKSKQPPRTERSAAHVQTKEKSLADMSAMEIAKLDGISYPELD